MYTIAGVTGRVGGAAADRLLEAGAQLRVLVRDASKGEPWRARGAQVAVLDLADREGLRAALRDADGCFLLLPFDPLDPDPASAAARLTASIAGAVADSRVPHVVMLSSGGADLSAGTGPIVGLHQLEQALRATGTTLTALRSGHFQEKVTDLLDPIDRSGLYPVFAASANVPTPMVATRDVGHVAAEALLAPPRASETVDVLGPQYTEREVATLLGSMRGRDLDVVKLPRDAWVGALVDAGLPRPAAQSLAELYAASEDGLLSPRGDRTVRGSTRLDTTLSGLLGAGVP